MKMDSSLVKRVQRMDADWMKLEPLIGVVEVILSRLHVKSLISVKSVSKLLYQLIRSEIFIKFHLRRSGKNAIYIFFPFMDLNRDVYFIDADGLVTESITLPYSENLSPLSMVCSYNGLICLTNFPSAVPYPFISQEVAVTDLEIRISNPATREVWSLPNCSSSVEDLGIGVAFGPGIGEYKLFRFFYSKSNSKIVLPKTEGEIHGFLSSTSNSEVLPRTEGEIHVFLNSTSNSEVLPDPECEVFSSSIGSWRCIGSVQHRPMGAHHIFANGKVHWFIPSEENRYVPGSILSVDMEEYFEVICLPVRLTELSFPIDFEGCLSVVAVDNKDVPVDIWILRNENASVWEKRCSAAIPYEGIMEDLDSVAARERDIFFITAKHYIILHTDESSWDLVDFDKFEHKSHMVFPYVESLLPCTGHFAGEDNNREG